MAAAAAVGASVLVAAVATAVLGAYVMAAKNADSDMTGWEKL